MNNNQQTKKNEAPIDCIVGIGELLWDIFPDGKRLGGAPANFAYHASKLGGNGIAVSAVGDDIPGNEILMQLVSAGLDTSYIQLYAEHPTGTVKVNINDEGKPEYQIMEPVAWDHIEFDTSFTDIANEAKAISFGTLGQRSKKSRLTIQRFVSLCPDSSIKILDINLRQNFYSSELIKQSLRLANYLKLNDEELEMLPSLMNSRFRGRDYIKQIMDEYSIQASVVTCGSKGSEVFFNGSSSFSATQKIQVVDTVGAGDAFTAAFVVNLLEGKQPEEANHHANKIAAFVCSKAGAMPRYE